MSCTASSIPTAVMQFLDATAQIEKERLHEQLKLKKLRSGRDALIHERGRLRGRYEANVSMLEFLADRIDASTATLEAYRGQLRPVGDSLDVSVPTKPQLLRALNAEAEAAARNVKEVSAAVRSVVS